MFETIQVAEKADGIGIITLNRPEKKNAISIRMRREIIDCLAQWKESTAVNIVVFTGAGEVFSAGFDLGEFGKQDLFDALFDSSAKYHREVWNFPKPTIAAVNGAALAGGLDLATLCDVRICSDSAFFGHPEIKFGAPPIFTPLRWIVGDGLARDLCLTGRRIDATEAHRIGLVSQIVAKNDLLERAIQIASTILEMPLETLKFTKAYLSGNFGKGFEESFRIEHDDAFQRFLLRAPKKD
ncbi:MAG: enoyl-CoA hydratase/isomerase family protein [Chloroflexota bacterium]|nr:enoyl-CoA hydratase/isomerase family protein [Chloroflexota bacterium]